MEVSCWVSFFVMRCKDSLKKLSNVKIVFHSSSHLQHALVSINNWCGSNDELDSILEFPTVVQIPYCGDLSERHSSQEVHKDLLGIMCRLEEFLLNILWGTHYPSRQQIENYTKNKVRKWLKSNQKFDTYFSTWGWIPCFRSCVRWCSQRWVPYHQRHNELTMGLQYWPSHWWAVARSWSCSSQISCLWPWKDESLAS